MAVIVKRYRVRHDDKTYKPGDVITGLSKAEEARLIDGSNGSIEKYVAPKVQAAASEQDPDDNLEEDDPDDMPGSVSADELIKPAVKK